MSIRGQSGFPAEFTNSFITRAISGLFWYFGGDHSAFWQVSGGVKVFICFSALILHHQISPSCCIACSPRDIFISKGYVFSYIVASFAMIRLVKMLTQSIPFYNQVVGDLALGVWNRSPCAVEKAFWGSN